MYFHHVLVTTDLSEISNRAVEYVAKRIPTEVEQITLLTVVAESLPYLSQTEHIYTAVSEKEIDEAVSSATKQRLNQVAETCFPMKKIHCTVIASHLSAGKEICEYAKKNSCDMIVMGSYGAGFFENLLVGSTVQKVLKGAPCPVMVIPYLEEKN